MNRYRKAGFWLVVPVLLLGSLIMHGLHGRAEEAFGNIETDVTVTADYVVTFDSDYVTHGADDPDAHVVSVTEKGTAYHVTYGFSSHGVNWGYIPALDSWVDLAYTDYSGTPETQPPAQTAPASENAPVPEFAPDAPEEAQPPKRKWLELGLKMMAGAGIGVVIVAGIAAAAGRREDEEKPVKARTASGVIPPGSGSRRQQPQERRRPVQPQQQTCPPGRRLCPCCGEDSPARAVYCQMCGKALD